MPTHRSLRMAEAIREVVATAILFEVADPRVRSVTVLRVEVSSDLRQATVYVSIMGPESEQKRTLKGLNHATGFLQARVAARLQTRFTPVINFKLDDSVKKSIELSRLIDKAVASDQRPNSPDPQVPPMPERLPEALAPDSAGAASAHPTEDAVSDST